MGPFGSTHSPRLIRFEYSIKKRLLYGSRFPILPFLTFF
jgi:hypothetical protein